MSEVESTKPDEVTEAIQTAKALLLKAFQGEKLENLGLEELRHEHGRKWEITLGFNRRWDHPPATNSFLQMAAIAAAARPQRTYKVVRVDLDDPEEFSISNRKDD
jgi:hypothetical protein